jgi:integrase/recombinase XerD
VPVGAAGTDHVEGFDPDAAAVEELGWEGLSLDAEEFLTWLSVERGRAANTLSAYRRDLTAYERFLSARGLKVEGVTEADVQAYVAALRADGRAPATVARALVAVRSLHRFLVDEGHVTRDPTGDVGTPRCPRAFPRPWPKKKSSRF